MLTSEYYAGNNPFGLAKGLGTRPLLAAEATGRPGQVAFYSVTLR